MTEQADTQTISIGDFFVASWGYEQTNITFFEVVGKTAKSLRLREVNQDKTPSLDLHGHADTTAGGQAVPLQGNFRGEAFTKRYSKDRAVIMIQSYMCATPWDGRPESYTSYA